MAMIKLAVVRIIINSSYVLISTTPSARLGNSGMHPVGCPGKCIILSKLFPGVMPGPVFAASQLFQQVGDVDRQSREDPNGYSIRKKIENRSSIIFVAVHGGAFLFRINDPVCPDAGF